MNTNTLQYEIDGLILSDSGNEEDTQDMNGTATYTVLR